MKNVISHESSPVLTAPANEARGIRTRSGRLIRAVSSDINTCRTSRANSETHYRARRSKKRIVECIRNTTTANKRLRSMEVDDVSSSSDTEAMDLDTNAFRNERYYCPYEGCTMNLCRHSPLFFHIRREHDEDFPRFHGHSKRFFFKTPKGDVFRFTDESCKDTIKRGESIIVERLDTGKERYYCPYIGCAVSLSDHHGIYKHVRRNHDEDFPCFKEPSANFIFKQTNGDIICFTDGMIDELMYVIFDTL
ncbi:hypothetical protein BJV82DRAFT_15581 [Fennellomyces sp. T-0311]|nr:hypothetical protein BJV82DRAFT_15581 [Fennellomyces sp. T-0311]